MANFHARLITPSHPRKVPFQTRILDVQPQFMTLPANDAFTLGLGNHDSSRPPYPLSLRPTSPKIPFVSSSKTSSKSVVRQLSVTLPSARTPKRSMSNGLADPTKGASPVQKTSESPAARRIQNGVPNGIATKKAAAVDWEIPRKALHSSIGEHAPL